MAKNGPGGKADQDGEVTREYDFKEGDDGKKAGVMEYKLGDAIKTVNGLVADIVAVNLQSGTYDIKYRKDDDVDRNVFSKNFQAYVPPPRRKRAAKSWEYRDEPVETLEQFISRTGVSAEFHVLPAEVKRRRGHSIS